MDTTKHTYNKEYSLPFDNRQKGKQGLGKSNKREPVLYALDSQNRSIYIDDAKSNVEYRCPGCSCIVTPRNNDFEGRKKIKYYAHKGDVCKEYRESMLHLLSKEILMEEKAVMFPDYKSVISSRAAKLESVREEVWDEDIQRRPDIVAVLEDGTEILIEINNTHEVDEAKAQIIREKGKACLEIDVFDQEVNKEKLRSYILKSTEGRRWINAPFLDAEYKRILAENGPIEKFLEEYNDLNDIFVRKTILQLLIKRFEKANQSLCIMIASKVMCEFSDDCKLCKSSCMGAIENIPVDFVHNYGKPETKIYEKDEVISLSYSDNANHHIVVFVGFKPCKKEKLKNRIYIEIKNKEHIEGLLSGNASAISPVVQIGEEFPIETIKKQPTCKYPLFIMYSSGTVVTMDKDFADNSYIKNGKVSVRMDNNSLDFLHSTLGYDDNPIYSLQKFGLYLSMKKGIDAKNCMLCIHRRKDYYPYDCPSRCTKNDFPILGKIHSVAYVCDDYEVNPVIPRKIESVLEKLTYQWAENHNMQMHVDTKKLKSAFDDMNSPIESEYEPYPSYAIPPSLNRNDDFPFIPPAEENAENKKQSHKRFPTINIDNDLLASQMDRTPNPCYPQEPTEGNADLNVYWDRLRQNEPFFLSGSTTYELNYFKGGYNSIGVVVVDSNYMGKSNIFGVIMTTYNGTFQYDRWMYFESEEKAMKFLNDNLR